MAYVKNTDGVVYDVDDAYIAIPLSQGCALATQEEVNVFWAAAHLGQPPRLTPAAPPSEAEPTDPPAESIPAN